MKFSKSVMRSGILFLIYSSSYAGAQVNLTDVSTRWVETWGSSQQQPAEKDALASGAFDDGTLRQVIHSSIAGGAFRLHLSNAFSDGPLAITSLHVARLKQGSHEGEIQPETDRPLTFLGSNVVVIPAGTEFWSDPVRMDLPESADLVITMAVKVAPHTPTFHAGSRATSFYRSGDHTTDLKLDSPHRVEHWYFIAGVEVVARTDERSIVVLGDSITDGHDSITDSNQRWTDFLAARLLADPKLKRVGVVNQGIGGNCLLKTCLGESALRRFDRDVIAQPGVHYLLVLEGVNDLGSLESKSEQPQESHDALVSAMEDAYRQIILRAHSHGILVYGCTMTPIGRSFYFHLKTEADRQKINEWIRTSHAFDAVIDFDAALRDPNKPDQMAPEADSKDNLHPGPGGYKRMGESVPLELFRQ